MTSPVSATREGMSSAPPAEDHHTKPHPRKKPKRTVWTTELITAEAEKHRTLADFRRASKGAYTAAWRNGILPDLAARMGDGAYARKSWTDDEILTEASRFDSKSCFMQGARGVYTAACKRGLLKRACVHMSSKRTDWSKDKVFEVAAKFDDVSVFRKEANGAYEFARRKGFLSEVREHMSSNRIYWTDDMILAEAARFRTIYDFREKSKLAYNAAGKRGMLANLRESMESRHVYWSDEMLIAEASRYDSRADFSRGSNVACQLVYRRGLADAAFAHMEPRYGSSDDDTIYLWRADGVTHNGLDVYKVGITSARLKDWRIGHVANKSGLSPTVLRLRKVTEKASVLEKEFLKFGTDPGYTGFDGCTEFRAYTPEQVDFIVNMIDLFSEEEESLAA